MRLTIKPFMDAKLISIVEDTLYNGLCCEKYQACKVVGSLLFLPEATSYFHLINIQRLFGGLLEVCNTPLQKLKSEIADHSMTRWEIDVIKQGASTSWIMKYAPRYICFLHEIGGMSIITAAYAFFPYPERRLDILLVPNFISNVIKWCKTAQPEAYPDSCTASYFPDSLLLMINTLPGEKPNPKLFEQLSQLVTADQLITLMDVLDTQTLENLMPDLRKLKKYQPDEMPTHKDVYELILRRGNTRPIILLLINGLMQYTDMASQFVPLATRIEQVYIPNLCVDPRHLDEGLFAMGSIPECKSIAKYPGAKYYRPRFLNLCLLFLWNLQKRVPSFKSNLPDLLALTKKETTKTKDEGNTEFQLKKFDVASFHYTTAIELGAISDPPHPDLAIFYSNRSECYLQVGLYQAALEDAKKALELKPDHDKSINRRDRALEALIKQVD